MWKSLIKSLLNIRKHNNRQRNNSICQRWFELPQIVYFVFSWCQQQHTRILVITTGNQIARVCARAQSKSRMLHSLTIALCCGLLAECAHFETAFKIQRQKRHQRLCLVQLLSAQYTTRRQIRFALNRNRNDANGQCIINSRIRKP